MLAIKEKEEIVYKALMVRKETHLKVVVQAKQRGLTVDEFINSLLKEKEI